MKHHTEAKEAREPCPKTGRKTKTTGWGQFRPIAVGAGSSGAGGAGDIFGCHSAPTPRLTFRGQFCYFQNDKLGDHLASAMLS